MNVKRLYLILFCFFVLYGNQRIEAQQKNAAEHKSSVVKPESSWPKSETESSQPANTQVVVDGITYSTTQNGIFITMPKAVGNVKLFSLTGELVWSGNLVQGRFFVPTRAGIYFLKVNNRSYKIVCK